MAPGRPMLRLPMKSSICFAWFGCVSKPAPLRPKKTPSQSVMPSEKSKPHVHFTHDGHQWRVISDIDEIKTAPPPDPDSRAVKPKPARESQDREMEQEAGLSNSRRRKPRITNPPNLTSASTGTTGSDRKPLSEPRVP